MGPRGGSKSSRCVALRATSPCDARACGPPKNSLRSLRSLRSNSFGESDHETRCARGRRRCASRASRYSPPRGPIRSLASTIEACHPSNTTSGVAKGCADAPGRAYAALRSAGRPGRARSALRALTWEGLSEWRERSERNEFPTGPGDRAPQGSRRAAATAALKRHGASAQPFAAQAAADNDQDRRALPTTDANEREPVDDPGETYAAGCSGPASSAGIWPAGTGLLKI